MINRFLFADGLANLVTDKTVCLFADAPDVGTNFEWLKRFVTFCPNAIIIWVVPHHMQEEVASLVLPSGLKIQLVFLTSWMPNKLFDYKELLSKISSLSLHSPKFMLTTSPYDSHGVWVKDIEKELRYIQKSTGAAYLVHDKFHNLFKIADQNALFERLYTRRFRIALYKLIVMAFLQASRFFLKEHRGWQR